MFNHNFRVSDPVRYRSKNDIVDGFITKIRGAKAYVAVDNEPEFLVSLSHLQTRKGVTPKRVYSKDQMIRLAFNIGDSVCFLGDEGKREFGFIQRLNHQTARIHTEARAFKIPYALLEKEGGEEKARKNRQRLEAIAIYADSQLEKFGLSSWRFCYDLTTKRSGLCSYGDKVISMSEQFCLRLNREEIEDTLLHEVAHALVGQKHGHNAIWIAKALEIGCSGKRTHKHEFVPPNLIVSCRNCGWHVGRDQVRSTSVCSFCRAPLYREYYTPDRWKKYHD